MVRLKVVVGVEVRKRGRGEGHGPEWAQKSCGWCERQHYSGIASESSWTFQSSMLSSLKDGSRSFRHTSNTLSPNYQYWVGLSGQVMNTNQQHDRSPNPLSTCSCPDFQPESPRQTISCPSFSLGHCQNSNRNLHLRKLSFRMTKRKRLFSLENKKVI